MLFIIIYNLLSLYVVYSLLIDYKLFNFMPGNVLNMAWLPSCYGLGQNLKFLQLLLCFIIYNLLSLYVVYSLLIDYKLL